MGVFYRLEGGIDSIIMVRCCSGRVSVLLFFFFFFTRCRPKGVVLGRASRRRAWSHLTDMEATLAVTLHLRRLEREAVTGLTGAAEGEEPKCLRHTWLRAKLCSSFTFSGTSPPPPSFISLPLFLTPLEYLCELLHFMISLTFSSWALI